MAVSAYPQLTAVEIEHLDPYALLAVLGKRVIHPGGRRSTEELLARGDFRSGQRVLDVGSGVATTPIRIARHFGAQVTAVDIAPLMLHRARLNVHTAGLERQVTVEPGDILALQFPDNAFDRVVAEAVTMFVDRPRAARELVRVCRPGGKVLTTEFLWRRPPTPEAREIFLGQVCPGMMFDTMEDWVEIYHRAGLVDVQVTSGPFEMMTPAGFLQDEGLANCLAFISRAFSRRAYLKKLAWLMPRMQRAVPYLGYVAISGVKPQQAAAGEDTR